uniref:Protein TIC 214 n=1 Tax=Croomia japonica TaxID=167570 RepID=A0A890JJJ7_9LILI|nr:hypothetical chloroplast RF19 [Croomia japonica]
MILKSFLLGNLLSLCMKIINSVVVVGLYYGFLTTFSIGPSYLFLLRARVMEEGTEKEVSATTGFITGQLMMFISIYYAPLHLALGRPHTITVLVLPYLLFHFFWNNHKNFFDYGSTTRNSMRNLSIQCVFLNNLIFQLFNHFILPSSTLARLVNIYMFRCNNKMLFVTSSFVGWLIGHILFMKWVGLVLFWIRQNHSIRSNKNKYLVSELRNSMARIFSILLFITCVYYLGRMPSPIVTKKLKETSETEERRESEEESDVETTSETKETKQEQEGSTEEDPSPCSEQKEDPDKIDETEEIRVNGKQIKKDEFNFQFKETCYKNSPDGYQDNCELGRLKEDKNEKTYFWFEKPFGTVLFDYKRWNRPLRYIKNDRLENAVQNEMSQYSFYICPSGGKKKISFTYPSSLSTFFEMIERNMSLYTTKKLSHEDLYNFLVYTNEQKKYNLSNELISRIKVLKKEKGPLVRDILEKRIRLCNDEDEQDFLPKMYDPFLNGPYRGTIKKCYSRTIIMSDLITSTEDSIEMFWINKIHGLLYNDSREFEHQKKNLFDRESLLTYIGNSLISIGELSFHPAPGFSFHLKKFSLLEEQRSENQSKYLQFVFDVITTDPKDQTTVIQKSIAIEEIGKKVPRWSYKLTDDLEEREEENEEEPAEDHEIRSRKAKRVVIFTDTDQNTDSITSTNTTSNSDRGEEVALIRYSQQSDFRRDIIKGSMRAQRRKTVILEMFQANVHSPLFLDRIDKTFFFSSFDISDMMNLIFRNWAGRKQEVKIFDWEEKEIKEKEKKNEEKKEENERIAISETWDTIIFAQAIRGSMLVTQSFLRKYIVLPSLIIAKNIGRMLLFQFPEWHEDFKEWNREMHVKCTYNGVQLSETEFPQNWLTDGIQIKILFPFCLKPCRRSKVRSHDRDPMKKKGKKDNFCFLTVWGMEAEFPFGSPRKGPSFFEPIYKEIEKKIKKVKKIFIIVLKEKNKRFPKVSKEKIKWVIKLVLVIKRIMKELEKKNPILLFELRRAKVYDQNENGKDSKINNKITHESTIPPMNWTNYLLIEKKTKDLADRTITIRNQIEQIIKDKKKIVLTCDDKRSESQKHIWQIFKRINIRLIRKSHYFMKFFIEKIYIDILLCTIKTPRINAQLFFESTKKILNKSIYNEETNQEETNQNTIHFISTIKKLFSNTNSNVYFDLSLLSQAYVFLKLSQTQLFNKYHLKSVLQYHGTYPFLRDKIKDYCITRGIFDFKPRHKKIHKSGMNEWKNWLKGHYQYNLSQTEWSRLVTQKWRNRVNQRRMIQKKDSIKLDSDKYKKEKDQLIHYVKQSYYAVDSLTSQKEKFKKQYGYDLLSHEYMNYGNRGDSHIYGSTLQVNRDQKIPYNFNIRKPESFYVLLSTAISDYFEEGYIIDTNKISDRKYFDCRILNFCLSLRKNIDIETWTNAHIDTKINKNTKIEIKMNYLKKMKKKEIFSLMIHQKINLRNRKKNFFDWMGMNQERIYRNISNLEPWFFSEFVLLFDAYKINPRIIPTKLLLLNFNLYGNINQYKNINVNQKKNLHISSNQKEYLQLENSKQEKNEQQGQGNLGADLQKNKKKDVEEDYTRSEIKKRRKKKQPKSNKEAKLDLFLKKYLLFQLRWDDPLNQRMINNIKVYCFLLRLINLREIAISSIQRGEMRLDVMLIQKDLSLIELIKKGILIIEPVRLSVKRNGEFILFQTIGISLVDKSKHQTDGKCIKKRYVDKKSFERSIVQHRNMLVNEDKNRYDFLVPENILSLRRRRELRIRICFNSPNWNVNVVDRNLVFCNENNIRNFGQFLNEDNNLNMDANKFMKFKLFLWPNYRLEDLACMNRYWFDTNNGSRFSMSRIYMYPRFRMG